MKKIMLTIAFAICACTKAEDSLASLVPFIGEDNLPEVTAVYPITGQSGVPLDEKIFIYFNKAVDEAKCTKAFSIDPFVPGLIRIAGPLLMFVPTEKFLHTTYSIHLSAQCEDSEGRDLKSPLFSVFSAGEAGSRTAGPSIRSVRAIAGSMDACRTGEGILESIADSSLIFCTGNPDLQKIEILYSHEMDVHSAESALQFYPDIPGQYSWMPGNTLLTLIPDRSLEKDVRYRVSSGASALAEDGRSLQSYTGSFRTGPADAFRPSVLHAEFQTDAPLREGECAGYPDPVQSLPGSVLENICLKSSVRLIFSSPMEKKIPSEFISFSPYAEYAFRWISETELVLQPIFPLSDGELYSLIVNENAADLFGRSLLPALFQFRTYDERPRVQAVGLESQNCSESYPGTGSPAGGDWNIPSCFWDDSLPMLNPSSYLIRGGDDGSETDSACMDRKTDNIRIVFSRFMDPVLTAEAVSLNRISIPSGMIRKSKYIWSDCSSSSPWGCRVLTVSFAEDSSSCSLNPNHISNFNLAKTDYPDYEPGFPLYILEAGTGAVSSEGKSMEKKFSFAMEGN